jgi:riboflavin kinase/FMN adenylyltransferase
MLTFAPHPALTLGREAPALLTTLERKQELIERACADIEIVVRPFTREFAQLSPEQFAAEVLTAQLGAAVVMVGVNFRFGRDRAGSFADLERLGERLGFEAIAEPLVCDDGGPWSSTRVRELVRAGKVELAAEMLGRPHMLSGTVRRGDQRGRQLGFPTCNLPDVPQALPTNGVYAVLVDLVGADGSGATALSKGVANLGLRPTVKLEQPTPLLEVHLLDRDRELYDQELRVHLVARLRAERRFDGLDALRQQIALDTAAARDALACWEPDPLAGGAWA